MNREKLGKHKNIIKCSNATAFAYFHCHLCDRIRFLYTNTKKNFDKNYLEYLLKDYLSVYDQNCGELLFLDNNINCARLPKEEWMDKKYQIEIRHTLSWTSLMESQVNSFKFDSNLILHCCYCGIRDIHSNYQTRGYCPICDEYAKTKNLMEVGAKKSDKKRSVFQAVNCNQTKKRIDIPVISVLRDSNLPQSNISIAHSISDTT